MLDIYQYKTVCTELKDEKLEIETSNHVLDLLSEVLDALTKLEKQLQSEQQAHNALREKLKGIYEQCLTKDMWLAVELNNAIKEDSK